MASRKRPAKGDRWVRCFTVTDPQAHPKGHTIYKVTSKVFPIDRPESITEIVVWRRYNDFKKLHQSLVKLHKALHRRTEFPPFAKAKLFGRFDEDVIEERRQSANVLLNFAGEQNHLFMSPIFQKFFEGGEKHAPELADKPLVPTKTPTETHTTEPAPEKSIEADLVQDPHDDIHDEPLGGVWRYPKVDDNISFNSDEDTDFTDDSALNTPLPETDISFFDPLKEVPSAEDLRKLDEHSNTWLLSAMTACAELDGNSTEKEKEEESAGADENGLVLNFPEVPKDLADSASETNVEKGQGQADESQGQDENAMISMVESKPDSTDISEFDPFGSSKQSDSKVQVGKGDLDLSFEGAKPDTEQNQSSQSDMPHGKKVNLAITRIATKERSKTAESVSTMDLGGQQDYIFQAANQISLAQQCEANGQYDIAFGYYKNGVGVLLKGVQGDGNKSRREAVRRKTAQYLLKAEDLYKRHIVHKQQDQKRWAHESSLSPSVEVDTRVAYLQGPVTELQNFRVLGIIDRVMLVMDKSSEQTYIIKVLQKTCQPRADVPNLLPVKCPYMVQMYKFYETSSAIYLLLQYGSGGKLWAYVSGFLQGSTHTSDVQDILEDSHEKKLRQGTLGETTSHGDSNVYSGHKLMTTDQDSVSDKLIEKTDTCNGSNSDSDLDSPVECSSSYMELFTDYTAKAIDFDHVTFSKTSKSTDKSSPSHQAVHHQASDLSELSNDFVISDGTHDSVFAGETEVKSPRGFQEVLEGTVTKPSMENFSIASFDSGDERIRLDSAISDHIECIPEVNEMSPSHSSRGHLEDSDLESLKKEFETDDELMSTGSTLKFGSNDASDIHGILESSQNTEIGDGSADELISSSKQLLKSVEEVLAESDREVNAIVNEDLTSRKALLEIKHAPQSNSNKTDIESPIDHLEETSIYDSHRTSIDSDTELTRPSKTPPLTDINENKKPESKPPQEAKSSVVSKSKSSVLSKQFDRSMSQERSLEMPSSSIKSRTRNLSSVFAQLDLASEERAAKSHLPEGCIRQWAAEIVVAIEYLHALGIVCRDLNPHNILLGDRGHILLTFFSHWTTVEHVPNYEAIDNLYSAPELRTVQDIGPTADWWSLGAILFELLTGRSLHSCHTSNINSHTTLSIPGNLSSEAQSLLEQLLCYNPMERLGSGINGVEEIKAHPFFNGIKWEDLKG